MLSAVLQAGFYDATKTLAYFKEKLISKIITAK